MQYCSVLHGHAGVPAALEESMPYVYVVHMVEDGAHEFFLRGHVS